MKTVWKARKKVEPDPTKQIRSGLNRFRAAPASQHWEFNQFYVFFILHLLLLDIRYIIETIYMCVYIYCILSF